MSRLFLYALTILVGSCGVAPPAASTAAPGPQAEGERQFASATQASGSFIRLKQFQIMDPTGFARPVVAASLLAPADWKLEGGVRWNAGYSCPSDMVTTAVRLTSPDGRMGFEVFPNYMAQWSDDPSYNQLVMQAAQMGGGSGCPLAQPMDARTFVGQVFAPGFRQGAQVLDAQPNQDVAAEAYQKAVAQTSAATGQRLEMDAARVRIAYQDQEEWIVTTVGRLATPGLTMAGMVYNYITFTDKEIGFRAPRGKLDANEALFATMMASIRVNPQWQNAVDQTHRNIAQIQAKGAADRSRIISQTSNEILDMQMEGWRNRQESQDRSMQKWSQTMRGVETYTDPGSGTSWELTSGYDHVWKTGSDEFLLTNDSNFNPNVSLPDATWTQMQPAP